MPDIEWHLGAVYVTAGGERVVCTNLDLGDNFPVKVCPEGEDPTEGYWIDRNGCSHYACRNVVRLVEYASGVLGSPEPKVDLKALRAQVRALELENASLLQDLGAEKARRLAAEAAGDRWLDELEALTTTTEHQFGDIYLTLRADLQLEDGASLVDAVADVYVKALKVPGLETKLAEAVVDRDRLRGFIALNVSSFVGYARSAGTGVVGLQAPDGTYIGPVAWSQLVAGYDALWAKETT